MKDQDAVEICCSSCTYSKQRINVLTYQTILLHLGRTYFLINTNIKPFVKNYVLSGYCETSVNAKVDTVFCSR